MNPALEALGAIDDTQTMSATNYFAWSVGNQSDYPLEWCHLVANSMGGACDETNIVAASKYNNSEQLCIENAISRYRREGIFGVTVAAACFTDPRQIHLADVIRYQITCSLDDSALNLYLDCKANKRPSSVRKAIHTARIATWANGKLDGGLVSRQDRQMILARDDVSTDRR